MTDRDTLRDYMEKSEFTPVQADALSRILSQMATKTDLQLAVKDLENNLVAVENKLQESIHRVELNVHRLEAKMSRWMITILVTMAALITLLNYFLD
jgi:hypothetical protein